MRLFHTAAAICLALTVLFSGFNAAYCATSKNSKTAKTNKEKDNPKADKPKKEKEEPIKKSDTSEEVKKEEPIDEDKYFRQAFTADQLPPIKMIFVEGGCFEMGDFSGEGYEDETPVHRVCLSSYYLSETEVTQELYAKVVGEDPAVVTGRYLPVNNFTWSMLDVFFFKLNKLTKKKYRLPTEAEWEYAARERGKKIRWSGTDDEDKIGDYAWFVNNSENTIHPVKTKKPNALGLYDMTGNVYEVTQDLLDLDYYKRSPRIDPLQIRNSIYRVARGGAYTGPSVNNRTTFRYYFEMDLLSSAVGIRLAL